MLAVVARDQQHVGGLHVAMHEARRVRNVERRRHLRDHRGGAGRRERAVALDHRAEVDARDKRHDDEQLAVVVAEVVRRDDVRVVEARGEPGLALEARAEVVVVGPLWADHLQRDGQVELHLPRPVHDAHAALGEQTVDPVAADHRAAAQPDAHHALIGRSGGCRRGGSRRGASAPPPPAPRARRRS
jgi:hypothetical protein